MATAHARRAAGASAGPGASVPALATSTLRGASDPATRLRRRDGGPAAHRAARIVCVAAVVLTLSYSTATWLLARGHGARNSVPASDGGKTGALVGARQRSTTSALDQRDGALVAVTPAVPREPGGTRDVDDTAAYGGSAGAEAIQFTPSPRRTDWAASKPPTFVGTGGRLRGGLVAGAGGGSSGRERHDSLADPAVATRVQAAPAPLAIPEAAAPARTAHDAPPRSLQLPGDDGVVATSSAAATSIPAGAAVLTSSSTVPPPAREAVVSPTTSAEQRALARTLMEGWPQQDPSFGMRELVTRPDGAIQPPWEFGPDLSYTEAEAHDLEVYSRLAELVAIKDPRVTINERLHMQYSAKWKPAHDKLCASIDAALTVPDHHYLWKVMKYYRHYDIRDCAATTPECLAHLQPEFNSKGPQFQCWRKCCVEHRRLRHLLYWVVSVLENAYENPESVAPLETTELRRYEAPYHVTSGALIGVMRDGGVLNPSDTDIDLGIPPDAKDEVLALLQAAPKPPGIVHPHGVEMSDGNPAINIHAPAPPDGLKVAMRDVHMELFYERLGLMRASWEVKRSGIRPQKRCMLYGLPVWCPADGGLLLLEFGAWQAPERTPLLTGLYGLNWCGGGSAGPLRACDGEDADDDA